ncbi:MAG: ribulose-phosphate 3-epimerase [Planctomycetes bacterium]|nr:ribulose-phosphate 3-epimerase [Planctomycetota bacterium]
MRNKIKISASILSANPMRFEEEIKRIEAAGIDLIHIDVMDGHFVPNITMGPFIVKGIKSITKVPLDIHLMIEHPERYIDAFAEAAEGSGIITFHIETVKNPKEIIAQIKNKGMNVGISLNPDTPVEMVENFVDQVDMVLVMSVNPGFSGQKFIPKALPKIARLRDIAPDKMDVQIDGGVTPDNISEIVKEGANIIVAASAIFKAKDPCNAIKTLRYIAEQAIEKDADNLVNI